MATEDANCFWSSLVASALKKEDKRFDKKDKVGSTYSAHHIPICSIIHRINLSELKWPVAKSWVAGPLTRRCPSSRSAWRYSHTARRPIRAWSLRHHICCLMRCCLPCQRKRTQSDREQQVGNNAVKPRKCIVRQSRSDAAAFVRAFFVGWLCYTARLTCLFREVLAIMIGWNRVDRRRKKRATR